MKHFRTEQDLTLRWRVFTVLPGAVLGIVDELVCLGTFGTVFSSFKLDFLFRRAVVENRKLRKKEDGAL